MLDRICYLEAKEFVIGTLTPDEKKELIALRAHTKVQAALSSDADTNLDRLDDRKLTERMWTLINQSAETDPEYRALLGWAMGPLRVRAGGKCSAQAR